MSVSLSIDRFEGDKKTIAVLTNTDGTLSINLPEALLPKGSRPGDQLTLTLQKDEAGTMKVAEATRRIQDELRSRDSGGDLQI